MYFLQIQLIDFQTLNSDFFNLFEIFELKDYFLFPIFSFFNQFAKAYNMVFAKNGLKVNFQPMFFYRKIAFVSIYFLNLSKQKSNLLSP
ncbi:hypothetical protein EAH69_13700 [Faecalibacter macacae]|uniref:Uncharacterized protein n=1 Tax=Faecalibacter macacae TaxID=1859289 RepID=A0A3L9M787_9FLAO|nr:hypothetical protein EAH69_13700 [Faecalibacter macacae]